jgi:hypothetical protein
MRLLVVHNALGLSPGWGCARRDVGVLHERSAMARLLTVPVPGVLP